MADQTVDDYMEAGNVAALNECSLFTKEALHFHSYTCYKLLHAETTHLPQASDCSPWVSSLDGLGTLTGKSFFRECTRSIAVTHESRLLLLHTQVIVSA